MFQYLRVLAVLAGHLSVVPSIDTRLPTNIYNLKTRSLCLLLVSIGISTYMAYILQNIMLGILVKRWHTALSILFPWLPGTFLRLDSSGIC